MVNVNKVIIEIKMINTLLKKLIKMLVNFFEFSQNDFLNIKY